MGLKKCNVAFGVGRCRYPSSSENLAAGIEVSQRLDDIIG